MSNHDFKGPVRPHPAAHSNFTPLYEAQLNHELRNFAHLEGQVGADVYHQHKQGSEPSALTRKKKLIIGLLSFTVVLFLAGAVAWFIAARHHDSTTCQPVADSNGHQSRQDGSSKASLAPVTITSHITITQMATTTVIHTTTAPIPTSIAQAAKSFFDSIHSVEASIHSSAESALSEALTFTTVASATPSSPTTTAETATGEPVPSEPTITTSSGAMIGFCSVPGMFCVRDLDGNGAPGEV